MDHRNRPGRYRALLVGVGSYTDDAISDLPCVATDLAALDAALRDVGYQVEVLGSERTGRNGIRTAVQSFIAASRDGDTLLLYLSGHGAHSDGIDYLVPADAHLTYQPLSDLCVPVDCNADIERSRAGDVAVFIDACREGFDDRGAGAMGIASAIGWSTGRIRRATGRRVGYVFACSRGEVARFVRTDDDCFSLFSRALAEIVANEYGPSTLAEFEVALRARVNDLARDHRSPRQEIRVLGESDRNAMVVLPRGTTAIARRVALNDEMTAAEAELAAVAADLSDRYPYVVSRIRGLAAPPEPDIAGMRAELTVIGELVAANWWPEVEARLRPLVDRVRRAARDVEEWRNTATTALADRDDMRREYQAYWNRVVHEGRAESPEVAPLAKVARDHLYQACDLTLARRAVDAFRAAVFDDGVGR